MNILGLSITRSADAAGSRWGRRALVIGATSAVVMGGGVAFAYWSANGTGSGAATAGTALAVNGSVKAVQSSSTLLYPGGSAPLIVNVHNPNSFSVNVTGLSLAAGTKPDGVSGGQSSCTATSSGVTLIAGNATGLPQSVGAGSDATFTIPGGVAMAIGSDNGCQSASFTFGTGISVTAAAG